MNDQSDDDELRQRLAENDERALAELFEAHRDRLWRLVNFRLDRRLYGRVDPDDILQESYINASQRIPAFLAEPSMSGFVWLRLIVAQTMVDVHRRHLGAQMRNADRDISIQGGRYAQATSVSMSYHLLAHLTSPSHAVIREEMATQLEVALEEMNPIDREVLALRHFEELTNTEVAEVLGIQQKAASIRYVRAIARLKDVLKKVPGFFTDEPG